jgi:group I intron endonuclease
MKHQLLKAGFISNFIKTFPLVKGYTDLHIKENFKLAKAALKGRSGVYCIICLITGAVYVGSSINLAERLNDHIIEGNTNVRLQNAITKYGLEHFVFIVVEFVEPDSSSCLSEEAKVYLLSREQFYLDCVFKLPKNLRYNISKVAEASFSGLNHLPETRVKMSEAKTGVNNPMSGKSHSPESKALISGANHHMYGKSHSNETRVKISDALTGPNNPMYGKVPTHAITVNVNSIDNVLVRSFSSQVACAKWLNVSEFTVRNYIKSGKVFRKQYLIVRSS